jgi:transcriptional regulator with XRE-family HTH domain
MTPAEFIRTARRLAGMTQDQFAAELGVAQATLCRWERGQQEPTHAMLQRAAKAAGATLRLELVRPRHAARS